MTFEYIVNTDDETKQLLGIKLEQDLGSYFSGKIYCKKLSHNQRNYEKRMKPIVDMIEGKRKEKNIVNKIIDIDKFELNNSKDWIIKICAEFVDI